MLLINKKLVIVRPGLLNVIEEPLHYSLSETEVLVEVKKISICGSDLKLYKGTYNAPSIYPIVPGHEWCGVVLEKGKNVSEIKVGDLVTGDCSVYCGQCTCCGKDKNLCEHISKFGITRDGFGQRYRVVDVKYLYVSPPDTDPSSLALTECFSVANHAIKIFFRKHRAVDASILIIGSGPIGMAIFELLKHKYRLKRLVILEKDQCRIDLLKKIYGYREIAGYNQLDPEQKFDVVFEATGNIHALDFSISAAAVFGTIICLGFIPDGTLKNLSQVVTKALTIKGSIGGTGEFFEMIDFLRSNPAVAEKFVTNTFPSENAGKVFEEACSKQDNLKIQLYF
ncbi:MAG: alcohol dehydrogenase catalytic domain-containing protein [Ferruginibacter sp.]